MTNKLVLIIVWTKTGMPEQSTVILYCLWILAKQSNNWRLLWHFCHSVDYNGSCSRVTSLAKILFMCSWILEIWGFFFLLIKMDFVRPQSSLHFSPNSPNLHANRTLTACLDESALLLSMQDSTPSSTSCLVIQKVIQRTALYCLSPGWNWQR